MCCICTIHTIHLDCHPSVERNLQWEETFSGKKPSVERKPSVKLLVKWNFQENEIKEWSCKAGAGVVKE